MATAPGHGIGSHRFGCGFVGLVCRVGAVTGGYRPGAASMAIPVGAVRRLRNVVVMA